MSDSTRENDSASALVTGELPPPRWFLGSLVVHGLVIALLWFTPVRQLVIDEPGEPPPPRMTTEQVETVVEQVRESAIPALQRKIEELLATESAMQEATREAAERYQAEAEQWATTAPERMANAAPAVDTLQQEALDLAVAAKALTESILDTQGSAQTPHPRGAEAEAIMQMRESREKQLQSQNVQRELKRMLDILEGQADLKAALAKAAEAQQDATRAVDSAIWHLQQLDAIAEAQQKAADRIPTREKWVEKAASEVEKSRTELAHLDEELKSREDKRLQNQRDQAAQTQKKREEKLDQQKRCLEREKQDVAKADRELEQLKEKIRERVGTMVETQRTAIDRQQQARELICTAVLDARRSGPKAMPKPVADALAERHTAPLSEAQQIAELYKTAVAAEQRTAELYRQDRAIAAALASKTPLDETLRQTEAVNTSRPEVDAELLTATIDTAERAMAHGKELSRVEREIDDMLATAKRMATLAQSRFGEDQSLVMNTVLAAEERPNGVQTDEASSEEQRETGTAATEPSPAERLKLEQFLMELAVEDPNQHHKDLAETMRTIMGGVGDKGCIPAGPPAAISTVGALGARRIGTTATGTPHPGWIYIDSWYIIGPFANPGRQNIETYFPPESVIDLDAVYRDKNGRILRWVFQHSPSENVRPLADTPYAIFYGYSEIWCEEAMNRTIAIGSDDYSKVWINGLLVWASGKQYKNWRADEAYRTVFFKKGLNKLLVRLENGHGACSMSVMINVQPAQ